MRISLKPRCPPYKWPDSPLKNIQVVTISAAHWHAEQRSPEMGFSEKSLLLFVLRTSRDVVILRQVKIVAM